MSAFLKAGFLRVLALALLLSLRQPTEARPTPATLALLASFRPLAMFKHARDGLPTSDGFNNPHQGTPATTENTFQAWDCTAPYGVRAVLPHKLPQCDLQEHTELVKTSYAILQEAK
jgi:hypothetical protein